MRRDLAGHGRDAVAIILAIGTALAVNLIIAAVIIDAFYAFEGSGLSENATQVITGGVGGMIGVLGAYLGFKSGQSGSDAGSDAAGSASSVDGSASTGSDSEGGSDV